MLGYELSCVVVMRLSCSKAMPERKGEARDRLVKIKRGEQASEAGHKPLCPRKWVI